MNISYRRLYPQTLTAIMIAVLAGACAGDSLTGPTAEVEEPAAATESASPDATPEETETSSDPPSEGVQEAVSGVESEALESEVHPEARITGPQPPLLIVDGVISSRSLADISSLDVESIELLKGAAAAALYGSIAQNGVVLITTKRR